MSTYNVPLQPPGSFRFDRLNEWVKSKQYFEQFHQVSRLSTQSEVRQVSTFLYTIGEDTEDMLSSTNISTDDRKSYAGVMAKFDGFFRLLSTNVLDLIGESQQPDESVEQFITNLYHLGKHCEYGNLRDEMIRDRIVVGIKDSTLSERFQLDLELTIEKAKNLVRQREAVHEQ